MSGSRSGFSVQISAVDNASKVIDGLNKRIARANAPVERLQRSFSKLADNTGVRAVSREMRGMADSSARIFANVGRAVPGLAALGGAFGVAGLAEGMKRAQDYGTNLQMTARRAGVGVGALQRLGNAAEISGGSAAGAADSLADLNKNMELAAHSGQGDRKFLAALAAMHINLRGANGQMRNSASVMDEVLHKLASMKDAQQQLYFGNAVLGGSFQTALWPAIQGGTKALDDYLKAAGQMVNLTPQQVEALRAGQVESRRLSSDVQNLAFQIASDLSPAEVQAAGGMSNWIEQNQKFIASGIEKKVKEVETAFSGAVAALGGWKAVGADVLEWYGAKFFPGIIGGAMRADVALKALAALGGYHGIGGQTDAQRQADLKSQQDGFDSWVYRHLGIHTGMMDRMGGPGGAPSGRAPSLPSGALQANMDEARKYLLSKGWTPQQTAGILANLSSESGFNPGQVGDNGTSFGLAQWHNDRAQLFTQWARQNGFKDTDLRTAPVSEQMAFMQWELTDGPEKAAGAALRGETTARGAAYVFAQDYERPAGGAATASMRASNAELFMPPSQPTEHTVKGAATVQVHINGAPAGSRVSASTSGDLFAGAPQVVMPMPPGGGPAG